MKVSIVIPCYNVEEYISDCIDSVLSQTFEDFEIICINDGSTDGTLEILNEYSAKDSRISVYNQINCGQSVARNKGMDLAKGKYILFIDSDDKVLPEAVSELVELAERQSLDHVAFKAKAFPHDQEIEIIMARQLDAFRHFYDIPNCTEFSIPQSGAQLMLSLQERAHFVMSPPLHFMKLSVLRENNIRFKPGIIHEDCIFSVDAMIAAKRAVSIGKYYYLRRVRASSIMTSPGQAVKHLIGWICTVTAHLETLLYKSPDHITARALELFIIPISRQVGRLELSAKEEKLFKSEISKYVSPKMIPMVERVIIPLIEALQIKNRRISEMQKNGVISNEVEALKSSEAYRVGMFVTWPARKVWGGIKCLRENGFRYTIRHMIGKTLRFLRMKSNW